MKSWNGWFNPPLDETDELSLYDRAQITGMSRAVAEAQRVQKELDSVLFWLASRIAAGEVDRLSGKDPFAFAKMTPGDWRKFFENVLRNNPTISTVTPASGEVIQLRKENEELRRRLATAEARLAELQAERDRLQDTVIVQRHADISTTTVKTSVSPQKTSADKSNSDHLPDPPKAYKTLFHEDKEKKRREIILLKLLAETGYSAEASMRWELTRRIEKLTDPDSGSIKRLLARMESKKLVNRNPVSIGKNRILILTLTDLGKNVIQAMGITVVESEWDRLMRLHGGQAQEKHAAQVCLFAHYARQRGWTTQVCPEVEPPADPDVLIEKDGEQIYVEVEAGSGSSERRMKKWRNQRNLQGFVAICAPTASIRKRLVREARANSKKGMATDFMWLRDRKKELDKGLWAYTW